MWRLLVVTIVALGLGLGLMMTSCGSVCSTRTVLTATDGGSLNCVQATDCPRPSNVLVCGATADQLGDCVGCEASLCVRYAGTCQ